MSDPLVEAVEVVCQGPFSEAHTMTHGASLSWAAKGSRLAGHMGAYSELVDSWDSKERLPRVSSQC